MAEMRLERIVVVVLLVVVCVMGTALLPRRAAAQADGQAGNVTIVLAEMRNGSVPIVLVDGTEQTLLVYEYDYGSDEIELQCARTYRFDKLLTEFNSGRPSVEDVRKMIRN